MARARHILRTPLLPARDALIGHLQRVVGLAAKNYIRSTKPPITLGISEYDLLEKNLHAILTGFYSGKHNLTDSKFHKILDKFVCEWDTKELDIQNAHILFGQYQSELMNSPFRRRDLESQFRSLLAQISISNARNFTLDDMKLMTCKLVADPRKDGRPAEGIRNAFILYSGVLKRLSGIIPSHHLSSYISLLLLEGSYAAFQSEDSTSQAQFSQLAKTALVHGENKLSVFCDRMIDHRRMVTDRRHSPGAIVLDESKHFAGQAYDAITSSLPDGLIAEIGHDPGMLGNAALEYEMDGHPMEAKPDRFDSRPLSDVLEEDIKVCRDNGQWEGAARLAFGLGRGYLRSNLTGAEKALDQGYLLLAQGQCPPTALAKGLLLEAQILMAQGGTGKEGQTVARLLEAKKIYGTAGVPGRALAVETMLLKLQK